jgi:hypothetical protein
MFQRFPYDVAMSLFAGRSRRVTAAVVSVAALAGGSLALGLTGGIDDSAVVELRAERFDPGLGDIAVIFDIGDIDQFVVEASVEAANRVGGVATVGRTGSLGMRRISRNGATLHGPPSGYLIPMVYVALPRGGLGGIMGTDVSSVLDNNSVVLNEITAGVTGAQTGDVIDMQAANGSLVPLTVAGVRPASQIGSSELVMNTTVAARLGANADTRVVIWGFDDREGLDDAFDDLGLIGRKDTRVSRSWDPPNPDSTLSTAETKVTLGEIWYRFNSNGSISTHPDWQAANLPPGRELLNSQIRIRARCHLTIVDDLKAALAEVAGAGLGGAINVANANSAGGCYNPRFSRVNGEIGFLSRHSYGQAIDTNTVSDCGGCIPQMNCSVVRIFRKHGFAWGGNFRRPDGMHFEWVGEPRDQIPYASTYCPNLVNPLVESVQLGAIGRDVLALDADSIAGEHLHEP